MKYFKGKLGRSILILSAFSMMLSIVAACNINLITGYDDMGAVSTAYEQIGTEPTETPINNADNFEPFVPYDETVVITVGRFFRYYDVFAPGTDARNNAFINMLYNELNIRVEVIFNVPHAEYAETLLRHKAADTLPDTFWIEDSFEGRQLFDELVNNNRLADLSQALSLSVGGFSRNELDRWDFDTLFHFVAVEGAIYAIPPINDMFNTSFTWIRKDWLDKVELDVPTTIDELEYAMLAFIQANLGGRNTAGFTFMPYEMFEVQHGLLPIFNAFSAYPTDWIEVNGRVEWGGIQPEVKDALSLLRDWTEKRIIRAYMLALNRTRVIDTYIITQRSGVFFSDWQQPWTTWNRRGAASANRNEGMEWVPVLGPLNSNGQFVPSNEAVGFGGQIVLASHPNPEAVIKAMNLYAEVIEWRNPEFESLYNRYLRLFERFTTPKANLPFNALISPQKRVEVVNVLNNSISTGVLEVPTFLHGYYRSMIESAIFYSSGDYNPWWALDASDRAAGIDELFGITPWWDGHGAYWGYYVVGNMFINAHRDGIYRELIPAFSGVTPAWSAFGESLMNLQTSMFIQIISGRLPLEAFDDFVNDWLANGGEMVTQEVNEILGR